MSQFIRGLLIRLLAFFAAMFVFAISPAFAATCGPATTPGAAPAAWQTYCWLDFSTYNDATARSASGQTFSFDLSDGSTLTLRVRATSTSSTAATARAAPSWTGAAVGNSSFLGIPGRPILYTNNPGSTVTFNITSINIIPPSGVAAITNYAFVVADAESTDGAEYLEFTTNGSVWSILDAVQPISGNQFPILTGVGTTTLRETGNGLSGNTGGYIAASNKPTTVTARLGAGGLQGVMFAVRFASIKLNKTITGARINTSDQFTFRITSTSSGDILASGTTTGSGNGPFAAAVISTASGIPITLSETMANGSVSTLSQYQALLTCTNATPGSSTVMPTNLAATSYNFGSLDFGDVVNCNFNNAAHPRISLQKQLAPAGRIFAGDQFQIRLRQGSTSVAVRTTTGTGAVIANGTIPLTQIVSGTNYLIDEIAAGTADFTRYSSTLSCTNAYAGSTTTLPTALNSNFSPVVGDLISCILTNTRDTPNALLEITKISTLLSDPVNGTTNPKAIPGAVVRYTVQVTNRGDVPVDSSTIRIRDPLPTDVTYNAASTVLFTNGTTPSGLNSFNPSSMVRFSSQASGGGPYNYTPATSGFDPLVKGVQISPTGIMSQSDGINHPSFTVSFEVQVK